MLRTSALWAFRHLRLWILLASLVDAALVTLVAVLIALPNQSDGNISGLVLALLFLLVLSIAFPVAGHVVGERERAGQRERRHHEQIGHLLVAHSAGQLPRLSKLSDSALGVTPTRYSIGGHAPYVPRRDYDAKIRELLQRPGPPYPFVVVWGDTKAGKSRTLAEALRTALVGDPVVVLPKDGPALRDLSQLGLKVPAERAPAVVVIDDLSPTDLESLTSDVLDDVTRWAVIASTMTAQRRAQVLETGSEIRAAGRAALEDRALQFELPSDPPTGPEREEAERLYPAEHFEGSIAETLVGSRELVARYKASRDTNPGACAVLRAAVDCLRAGLLRPVTEAELFRLFPIYLRAVRVDLDPSHKRFLDGLHWASRPIASQVSLLRPIDSGHGAPSWRIFDHVATIDDGFDMHPPRPVPPELWDVLITAITPEDCVWRGNHRKRERPSVCRHYRTT
jgi:hypothetical protein